MTNKTISLTLPGLTFSDRHFEKKYLHHQARIHKRMSRIGLVLVIMMLASFHIDDIINASLQFYIAHLYVYAIPMSIAIISLLITFFPLYYKIAHYFFLPVMAASAFALIIFMHIAPETCPYGHMIITLITMGLYLLPNTGVRASVFVSLPILGAYYVIAHIDQKIPTAQLLHYSFFILFIEFLCIFARYSYDGITRTLYLNSVLKKENNIISFCDYYSLTAREAETARLVFSGKSASQIAQHCNIGTETVRKHLSNMYEKTETHSRMEFIANFNSFFR